MSTRAPHIELTTTLSAMSQVESKKVLGFIPTLPMTWKYLNEIPINTMYDRAMIVFRNGNFQFRFSMKLFVIMTSTTRHAPIHTPITESSSPSCREIPSPATTPMTQRSQIRGTKAKVDLGMRRRSVPRRVASQE